ncbi:DUF3253 domain-containing protein [Sphingomonas sp. PB2P12]|uniref:DUF3253 domain-containing protein n=1 Tax=Sphingomonas sandaracina TaxID=3096157 RepID=UPI002FC64A8D
MARKLAAGMEGGEVDWRSLMPTVHAVVDQMVATGQVQLSWKGQSLPTRAGPYRIGREPR